MVLCIYTDGSGTRRGNPGGWACCVVQATDLDLIWHQSCGYDADTTNNRMELTAAIEGLRGALALCNDTPNLHRLLENHQMSVILRTDSMYVINLANGSYRPNTNNDLYDDLHLVIRSFGIPVDFQHVRGHSGDTLNERMDKLAKHSRKNGHQRALTGLLVDVQEE